MSFIFDEIKRASHTDQEDLLNLVNTAYRPKIDQQTWTHESDIVDGERVTAQHFQQMLTDIDSFILLGLFQNQIIACAHIYKAEYTAQIGMLCVKNNIQTQGIGKAMLQQAESFATTILACHQFKLSVITSRLELLQFYIRRGYQPIQEFIDYPIHAGVGRPKQDNLRLQVLVKMAY